VLAEAPSAGYELEVRAIQTGASAAQLEGTLAVPLMEIVSVGSAAGGTMNLDLNTQQVYLYNTAATTDFTLNLRGDGSNSLDNQLSAGNAISATVVVREGASLKALSAVQIDGAAQTVQWQNNNSSLTISKLNVISLTVIKTAANTYTVLGCITTVGA
jgi:hypothetical protein